MVIGPLLDIDGNLFTAYGIDLRLEMFLAAFVVLLGVGGVLV